MKKREKGKVLRGRGLPEGYITLPKSSRTTVPYTSTSPMAYIKALFFLAVVVAAASAAEEAVREKKQVFVGSPYTAFRYTDDGKYYPGKYETPSVPAVVAGVVPAVRTAVPAAVPAAIPAYRHAAYVAHPYYY